MARQLRLELPGGIYHVTARGIEWCSIFREAIARAYREYDYRMREIARALGCHYVTMSRRLRAFEKDGVSWSQQDLTALTREHGEQRS